MEINKSVNPHFENFIFDWDSKIYLLVGGYGSSKSYHIALKIILKLLQEKRTALVVREVYDTIRESCYSLFAEICYTLDLSHLIKFTRSPMNMIFYNGSKIIFRGLRVLPQFEISPHNEVMAEVEKIPRKFKFVGLDFGFETSYNAVVRMAELTYAKDRNSQIIFDEFSIDAHTLSAVEYGLDTYDVANIKHKFSKSEFGFRERIF